MPFGPVLTLFVWADGSYFDSIINNYQNMPHFIVPLNPTTSPCAHAGSGLCANATNASEDDNPSVDALLGPLRNMTDTSLAES